MSKQRVAVLGLGRFGRSLVQNLAGKVELVVVDRDRARVDAIAREDWRPDFPVRFDTTDQAVMERFICGVDTCVVAFGENIQASLLTTLIVCQPEMKIRTVVVRAQDDAHAEILRAVLRKHTDIQGRVVQPEQEVGLDVARSLINPDLQSLVETEGGPSIFSLRAQKTLYGLSAWGKDLGATVLLISRKAADGTDHHFVPLGDTVIEPGDTACLFGSDEARTLIEEVGLFAPPQQQDWGEEEVRKVAVIGLGRFGRTVYNELKRDGTVELIGADRDEKRADEVGGMVLDATNVQALRDAGVGDVDVCVVSIGKDDFNAAVLTTRAVAQLDVPTVVARAQTREQAKILDAILDEHPGRHRVIQPEWESGVHQGRWLAYPEFILYASAGPGLVVVDLRVHTHLSGKTLIELALPPRYGFRVVQITRGPEEDVRRFEPGANTAVLEGDTLRLLGPEKNLMLLLEEMTASHEAVTQASRLYRFFSGLYKQFRSRQVPSRAGS